MSQERGLETAVAAAEQHRLLLLEHLGQQGQDGDRTALYNVHFGFRWYGEVAVEALHEALASLVERHEILRTSLRMVDGEPYQVIEETSSSPLRYREHPVNLPDERGTEALRLAAEHAREPFDLGRGPLLRADLVTFAPGDHAFLLTFHHTVFDGWSAGVFFEELTEGYTAALRGRPLVREPLPLQYADFAEWQRDLAGSGEWERQATYWTQTLRGAPAVLELPADRPRPAGRTFRGDLAERTLPDGLDARLDAVCRAHRCTRFGVLLAAFGVLLRRLSGAEDLVVGTVDAGRGRPELERLIGLFTNTLALRLRVRGDRPFTELLAHTRDTVADAQSHAQLPFAEVVRRLRPERAHSHNPLFQVMFDVQPGGAGRLRLPGVRSEPLRVRDRRVSLFDLSLSVESAEPRSVQAGRPRGREGDAQGAGPRLVAEYATDLFERDTVLALLEAYQTLLGGLLAEPERAVDEVPALDDDARAGLLARQLAGERAAPAPSVTKQIAARLGSDTSGETAGTGAGARAATAPALVAEDAGLTTYAELDAWSAAVAADLVEAGVRPGDVVGLPQPRSIEAVAALLGVLRAGASYLPIDPEQPRSRTSALLAQARPAALLAAPAHLAGWEDGDLRTVPLRSVPRGGSFGPSAPWHPAGPAELAYILYTSGSTGAPKGVMVTHGGLATYVAADLATYQLSPADRVLMFTDMVFDVSAEEIFPALAAGAALVPRTARMMETPADFFAECERLGVTVAHLPTAWFHQLAADLPAGVRPPARLRAMAIGGEAPSPELVERWRAAVPDMLLTNVYGPTETTIVATLATLAGGTQPPPPTGRMPLGEPIPGTSCYLLDHQMEPVPPGTVGEIHLGGGGLARGYLGDPARTAAAFVPHPFAAGQRLYRTGDLARLGPDGELEYRGRTDNQAKIRGYRVEPGEVETALLRVPEVASCVVVPHPDRTSLVAYVVPAEGARLPDQATLLAGLAERVPAYLVPSAVIALETIPLRGNHKVDTDALPPPPTADAPATGAAPRGAVEESVAAVWREVLGVSRVGRQDDFFARGGHSLLATGVISRLRREFGDAVRLTQLFERPRLSDFAAAIERATSTTGAESGPNRSRPARPTLRPRPPQDDGATVLAQGVTEAEAAALLGGATPAPDGRRGRIQG